MSDTLAMYVSVPRHANYSVSIALSLSCDRHVTVTPSLGCPAKVSGSGSGVSQDNESPGTTVMSDSHSVIL